MSSATPPPGEEARIAELVSLALLETPAEERFDRITRLAVRLFDVPIALVTLVDTERQWIKSRQGIDLFETSRDEAFCAHTILGEGILHVRDASTDLRFADNPLVREDPAIRFYAGHPVRGPRGQPIGALCVISGEPRDFDDDDAAVLTDLAEVVEHEVRAMHLTTVDGLTGLSNRRGFEVFGDKVLAICDRQRTPAAVLFADLDGLKEVNDRFGHLEGDQLLKGFAHVLRDSLRESDLAARFGGDEFVVLLTGTEDPEVVAESIRAAVDRWNESWGAEYRLSASIGTARFDPDGSRTLDELVHRADGAMYRDKQRRRIHDGPASPFCQQCHAPVAQGVGH